LGVNGKHENTRKSRYSRKILERIRQNEKAEKGETIQNGMRPLRAKESSRPDKKLDSSRALPTWKNLKKEETEKHEAQCERGSRRLKRLVKYRNKHKYQSMEVRSN